MFQELIVITSLEPVVIGIFSRDCSKKIMFNVGVLSWYSGIFF
jgi:hypothetical protein